MDFMERVQKSINKGLDNSKNLFNKARDKAQDLGELGVLRVEVKQLEAQIEKNFAKLGAHVYDTLYTQGQQTVSKKTPNVKDLLEEIENTKNLLEKKEAEINKYE